MLAVDELDQIARRFEVTDRRLHRSDAANVQDCRWRRIHGSTLKEGDLAGAPLSSCRNRLFDLAQEAHERGPLLEQRGAQWLVGRVGQVPQRHPLAVDAEVGGQPVGDHGPDELGLVHPLQHPLDVGRGPRQEPGLARFRQLPRRHQTEQQQFELSLLAIEHLGQLVHHAHLLSGLSVAAHGG